LGFLPQRHKVFTLCLGLNTDLLRQPSVSGRGFCASLGFFTTKAQRHKGFALRFGFGHELHGLARIFGASLGFKHRLSGFLVFVL